MHLKHLLLVSLTATAVLMVNAQTAPLRQLSIPGAIPLGGVPARPQFRNDKLVRVRRPVALRAQSNLVAQPISARLLEEAKPVTESAEDDHLPDAFLPSLLREQQLAQAQQSQFQQAAAAFLNNEPNSLQETQPAPNYPFLQQHQQDETSAPPQQTTRFVERPAPSPQPTRPTFNDYGIGSGLQRYGGQAERAQPQHQAAPVPNRSNVIRSRPQVQRPQYEAQSAPAPAPVVHRQPARPKPIQPRPSLIDQNDLQDERQHAQQQAQRRQRPVAQTIRKWREENEDGSITWGYENDDGSFKEELIGTNCVTKGTYGYVDPDGNKREYHYETGIKCDPNTRETDEELQENGFINYEENRAVLPNGIEIDMSQLGKKKSKRPGAQFLGRN